ncbi:EboA domain-containing protein [Streptomyces sp. NPDC001410]|uniref:EboA domain-containing protein n=1 Tax=Streptomyces sp. NPDC001410 TaxID=3364574 RepID=UPI0036804748
MTAPTLAQAPAPIHNALTTRTLKESLLSVLTEPQRQRLAEDTAAVEEQGPTALNPRFPAAGRHYGRGPLPGWADWHVEDGIRALFLTKLPLDSDELAEEAAARYWGGDAAERRGVLRALPFLPIGAAGLPLTDDALRTNDTRLIAAALGPYARTHLDQYRWRQAVLKCLFTGIPLRTVAGLRERRDAELARMALGFAAERRAASRTVPADLWLIATPDN